MNKKIKELLIGLGVGLFIIAFLEQFGATIIVKSSDFFQNRVCSEHICINKPKGWIPAFIKRDGNIYNFNLINTKYIPFDINKTAFLPIESEEIMLVKGMNVEDSLIINYLKKLNLNNISSIKKYSYKGENFFYCKECKFLIYPKKRIVFSPVKDGFDIKFFYEMVRE